jgi:hypothetical protein
MIVKYVLKDKSKFFDKFYFIPTRKKFQITTKIQKFGDRLTEIAKFFETHHIESCKNFYEILKHKHEREMFDTVKRHLTPDFFSNFKKIEVFRKENFSFLNILDRQQIFSNKFIAEDMKKLAIPDSGRYRGMSCYLSINKDIGSFLNSINTGHKTVINSQTYFEYLRYKEQEGQLNEEI